MKPSLLPQLLKTLLPSLLILASQDFLSVRAAEAPPSAPVAATLAPLGDSRTAIISFDTAGLNRTTLSHLNWANALNRQKFPCAGNFGIAGATSDIIVAKMLAPALAARAAYMPILMGVNDVKTPGFTAEHTMANIAKAADAALAHGAVPILFTDPGADRYNAAQVVFINDVNTRIKAYCAAKPKAVLFDLAALISTQRTPAIVFQPGWSYDGVHLAPFGAYKTGQAFAALMESLGAGTPAEPGLAGNLLANPIFSGTGGAVGAGNAGTLPDTFAGSRDNTNCAAVFSLCPRGDGAREFVATLTTGTANTLGGMRISQPVPATGINPGDRIQAGVQVDLEAGHVNLTGIRVEVSLLFSDGTFASAYDFDGTLKGGTISSLPGAPALALTLQTPPARYPEGKVLKSITFRLCARTAGQGGATLRFRQPWCKKIAPE